MSNQALTLWRQSVTEYCSSHNMKYTIFKKGTKDYTAVKAIYEKKLKGNCCKVYCVNGCKKSCKCDKK